MTGVDRPDSVSQIHLQPMDSEKNAGEKGKPAPSGLKSGFQLNSLGGPLEGEFTDNR